MPFVHDGIRGIADFVERVADSGREPVTHEPVDAKLARTAGQTGARAAAVLLRRCHRGADGRDRSEMHIWLGSGRRETLRVNDFRPYWRRLRGRLPMARRGPNCRDAPRAVPALRVL